MAGATPGRAGDWSLTLGPLAADVAAGRIDRMDRMRAGALAWWRATGGGELR